MSDFERFDAYYVYPSCRSTGRDIHANGEFVFAADLEMVVRQRDEAIDALSKTTEQRNEYKAKLQDADYNLGLATTELEAVKRRLEKYEARERADNETLHEFAEALACKRKLEEEG